MFAGEAGFDGVEGGFGLTLRRCWSAGFLGVLAIGSETGGGDGGFGFGPDGGLQFFWRGLLSVPILRESEGRLELVRRGAIL